MTSASHPVVVGEPPTGETRDLSQLFQSLLGSSPSALAIYRADPATFLGAELIQVNPAFTQLTGYVTADLQGSSLDVLAGSAESPEWLDFLAEAAQGQVVERELPLCRKDLSVIWDRISLTPIEFPVGVQPAEPGSYWIARHIDVTEQREAARERDVHLAYLSLLGSAAPYQSAVVDAKGQILAVNDAWQAYWAAISRPGVSMDVGDNYVESCDLQLAPHYLERDNIVDGVRAVLNGQAASFAIDFECDTTSLPGWYQLQCNGITAKGREDQQAGSAVLAAAVITQFDITTRKSNEVELRRRALTDLLTGQLNRAGLVTALATSPPAATSSVVHIDLDTFKQINDSYGHSVGDELLVTVAIRLSECVGDAGLVCRLSGDGFVVYLPDRTPADVVEFTEGMLAAVAGTVQLAGGAIEVTVSATAGVAHSTTSEGIETLLRDADSAMYRAKKLGRGRIEVYTPELHQRSRRRLDVEMGLRRALNDHEFVLHYQPVVDLRTGVTVAQEALVRWQTDEGLAFPAEFLDVAESSGLIRPLGRWVLRAAIREAAAWRAAGHDWVLHVNLSAAQLTDDEVVGTLTEALAAHDLAGDRVCLEVTETELLPTIDGASAVLEQLRATGAGLALDDFGVGYFSCSHLIDLPVSMLKIDRAFVQGMETRSRVAIVSALTTLSNQLDLEVVAEGLETREQIDQVVSLGCVLGQGYLLGRPAPEAFAGHL